MKINFDFKNCFGIRRLQKEIDFKEKQSVAVIYAPNGMMKSSFAKTCDCMSKEISGKGKKNASKNQKAPEKDPICDRLHPDRHSLHIIKVDGRVIDPSQIFVANPDQENFDASRQVTDFLASKVLKEEYDQIVGQLESARKAFVKAAANISQSSDIDKEIVEAFCRKDENALLYDCIGRIRGKLKRDKTFYDFRFDDVFDDHGQVKRFLEENQDLLDVYVKQYNKLMNESDFFHVAGNGKSFGTYQAIQMGKAFKGEEYFTVGHRLMLKNDSPIRSIREFNDRIETEKNKIFADEELKKAFEAISKKIDSTVELRRFSEVITRHPDLLPMLADYDWFRKEVLLGYINHPDVRESFYELSRVYKANGKEMRRVMAASQQEQAQWGEIVSIYNTRFHSLPFRVKIENQQNVLLKQEEAKLAFEYLDQKGVKIPQSRESLLTILSKGEKRAFLILQFLFAIEARKKGNVMSLIVMDDISDSFDYQNKYAIVEYLKDLAEKWPNKFKIILLTHNFDFYRTVTLRLKGMVQQYMAVKEESGSIRIDNGVYVMRTPFELEMRNSDKSSNLIALIPFVRNLVEYYQEKNSKDFMTLTACLHVLKNTRRITDKKLATIFGKLKGYTFKYVPTGEKVIDIVFREADKIESGSEVHEIMIEDKVILSIAIRLKAEFFLKKQLVSAGKTAADLATRRNQTSEWIDLYKAQNPPTDKLQTMEKVNMMTPEYIHLNSFMYEPLIDMSVWHLIDLYKEVKALLP